MHRSRLNSIIIDCRTDDIDAAARFWGEALGRPVDLDHPGSHDEYRMLHTPPDELMIQLQRVGHASRVHLDIETDDIPAEVERLERLGATVAERCDGWTVMAAPTGQRFCVGRVKSPRWPTNATEWPSP